MSVSQRVNWHLCPSTWGRAPASDDADGPTGSKSVTTEPILLFHVKEMKWFEVSEATMTRLLRAWWRASTGTECCPFSFAHFTWRGVIYVTYRCVFQSVVFVFFRSSNFWTFGVGESFTLAPRPAAQMDRADDDKRAAAGYTFKTKQAMLVLRFGSDIKTTGWPLGERCVSKTTFIPFIAGGRCCSVFMALKVLRRNVSR